MYFSSRSLSLGLLCLGFSFSLQAAVWTNKNQWDERWEQRYSDWVANKFHAEIFTQGPYAGIKHDCADAVYYARLIFAYENQLPFAAAGGQISNSTDQFDALPAKQRLRRFIDWVGNSVGSVTVMQDTYPIALNRQSFRPGVVAALPRRMKDGSEQPGHDQIVTRVERNGVIHYLKSTVPAKVQRHEQTTLVSFIPERQGGSFRWWKQPGQFNQAERHLPGYGTDQYSLPADSEGSYADALQQKLALEAEPKEAKLARLSGEICHQVQQRVPIVDEALVFKRKIGSRCMNYEEYDAYSTPSRDGKIKKALAHLLLTATGSDTESKSGAIDSIAPYLNQACGSIQYLPGKQISAARFAQRLLDGQVSYDPNQSAAARWGDSDAKNLGCKVFY
jgi:hypothetical protein